MEDREIIFIVIIVAFVWFILGFLIGSQIYWDIEKREVQYANSRIYNGYNFIKIKGVVIC